MRRMDKTECQHVDNFVAEFSYKPKKHIKMTLRKKSILLLCTLCAGLLSNAQTLVRGGNFKDRILPMRGAVTLDTLRQKDPNARIWGAPGVQNRFIDNGCEIDGMNIWGGNVYKGDNGRYYQFLAGWDGVKNAFNYWSRSHIYRVESSTSYGPFTNPVDIGSGHNPEVYRTADGTYVVYALIGNSSCWRHVSRSLDGPWTFEEMPYNLRDRALLTGSATTYSNWTFAKRQDGSMLCMCRGGGIWISRDGLQEYGQVKGVSCYPNGGGGTFEDPVVWRDEVQYHMIVNDWKARTAYYSRSADGFHWVAEDGVAYDINVSVHPDGQQEKWYKYERPRVFQDEYGRAVQLNMAVIDTIKAEDKAGDNHSSKNIAMPLNPGLRMRVLNTDPVGTSTDEIKVLVYKEAGFSPATDLDMSSLRFGSHSIVNKGGGASAKAWSTDSEGNLLLTFNGKDTGIGADEFAPKMLGKYADGYTAPSTPTAKAGGMCYGYAKLAYYNYTPAYLSPLLPEIGTGSMVESVRVDNYGLSTSKDGITVKVLTESGMILGTGTVKAVSPYASEVVALTSVRPVPAGSTKLVVAVYDGENLLDKHPMPLTDINARQAAFASLYNDAANLYRNKNFANGRDEMSQAMSAAQQSLNSFCSAELATATSALEVAIARFKAANPNVANVSCRNYYIKAGNIASGNMYMYVAADGSLARKRTTDDSCVFTLIVDGDNGRVYLYNPSSKSFVVAKDGNGGSFWTASATDAYQLAEVKASGTLANGYVIKGVPTSTSTYNYLNAYGGANHTELSSYTETDKNSQWLLVDCPVQKYAFSVEKVTTGLDAFLETVSRTGADVTTSTSEIRADILPQVPQGDKTYTMGGILSDNSSMGIHVYRGRKYLVSRRYRQ